MLWTDIHMFLPFSIVHQHKGFVTSTLAYEKLISFSYYMCPFHTRAHVVADDTYIRLLLRAASFLKKEK